MKDENVILGDFKSKVLLESMIFPIITVYEKPKDFPEKWIARMFDLDRPTNFIITGDSFADIKEKIPDNMALISPSAHDDPVIKAIFI